MSWSRRDFLSKAAVSAVGIPFFLPSCKLNGRPTSCATSRWYPGDRVHAHSRLSPRWTREFGPDGIARALKALGVGVVTRHVKTGAEPPWWHLSEGELGGGFLRETTDSLRNQDIVPIAYYWHLSDEAFSHRHPGAICRSASGSPARHRRRGIYLDITDEAYSRLVRQRLEELAAAGFAGVYLDETHMPADGCYGTSMESAVAAGRGSPADDALFARSEASLALAEIEEWRASVQAEWPGFEFIVSTASFAAPGPSLISSEAVSRHFTPKTELFAPVRELRRRGQPHDESLTTAWGIARVAELASTAPHIWIVDREANFDPYAAAVYAVAAGGVANLDLDEMTLLRNPSAPELQSYRRAFEWGGAIAEALSCTQRTIWISGLFMEDACHRLWRHSETAAWQDYVLPSLRSFDLLLSAGIPAGVASTESIPAEGVGDAPLFLLPSDGLAGTRVMGEIADRGIMLTPPTEGTRAEKIDRLLSMLADIDRIPPMRMLSRERLVFSVYEGSDSSTICMSRDLPWQSGPRLDLEGARVLLQEPARAVLTATQEEMTVEPTSAGYQVLLPTFRNGLAVTIVH